MAVYNYSVPSIQPYQGMYFNAFLNPTNLSSGTQFSVCEDRINGGFVFKQGYCGNPSTGSWISTLKSNFSLDWSDDPTFTDTSSVYFPIINDNNNLIIDWNNPFIPAHDYDYGGYYNSVYISSGISKTIEDSSTIEPSDPCDSPYSGVISAIYTAAAVPIVLCFFFVIYKIFMRLRG